MLKKGLCDLLLERSFLRYSPLAEIPMKFIYTLLQFRRELILTDLFETGEEKKRMTLGIEGKDIG